MDTRFFNSLTEGDFGWRAVLRQSLTEGDFWARRQISCCVYRGETTPEDVDFTVAVAMGEETGTVTLPDFLPHLSYCIYFYAVRWVSPTGKEEGGSAALLRLRLDASGQWDYGRPNAVDSLVAQQRGSTIHVSWAYCSLGHEATPSSFVVSSDQGNTGPQVFTMVKEVPHHGDGHYEATILASAGSKGETLQVCALTADGVDDGANRMVFIPRAETSVTPTQIDSSACF